MPEQPGHISGWQYQSLRDHLHDGGHLYREVPGYLLPSPPSPPEQESLVLRPAHILPQCPGQPAQVLRGGDPLRGGGGRFHARDRDDGRGLQHQHGRLGVGCASSEADRAETGQQLHQVLRHVLQAEWKTGCLKLCLHDINQF